MTNPGLPNPSSPNLFKALFEQSGDSVLIASCPNGLVLEANPKASEILMLANGDIGQLTLFDLVDEDGAARLRNFLQAGAESSQPFHYSGTLMRLDQSAFRAELDIRKVDDCCLVTFQDYSEYFRAREDIELRNIAIANVTSGVTVADARLPDLPLIYVNRGFEKITGYSAREAVGRSCRFLQGEENDQPDLDILREALRAGQPCVVQLRNFRKDGTLFYNELHISPIRNEADELTHFVGIQLDVTEQVRARESLERSEARYRQALEQEKQLNEFKTRFISMVSHEFRTPMTGIQASAAFLRKYGGQLPEDKKARHLVNIETSLKRMNRLLDDVLFFSRAESHKVKVERKALDLPAYLPGLVENLSHAYPGREIKLENRLPPGATYLLDAHLLDHILHNLIGNALKYSSPETAATCTVTEEADALVFAVEDHGIGIPEADQHRLFEAFHRAGNVGIRQGTGLGLNIALRATELLEGEISFKSTENAGSTFVVRLPKTMPHPETQS